MKKSILIGMTAIALTLGACGRKTPPAEIPPVEQPPAADANSTDPNSLEVVELPALQADLVAKAGSDTIYFGTDKYDIDEASRATLTAQAQWLIANPNVRASIEGHADERGTREYNIALGARRGSIVVNYLVSKGVDQRRITTKSFGKERPVAICNDISCWSQNRRAVTVVQ